MNELKVRGGARVGWLNATWPFATLTATSRQLSLAAAFSGTFDFAPGEVAALEVHGSIPLLGTGLRIVHTRPDYPPNLIFWCFGNPRKLIERIEALGFMPRAPRAQVPERSGLPVRWSFIIALLVMWNGLFLMDGFVPWQRRGGPGIYVMLAVSLLVATALALRLSPRVQALVLKPGREFSEIRPVVNLVLLVCGLMAVALLGQLLSG